MNTVSKRLPTQTTNDTVDDLRGTESFVRVRAIQSVKFPEQNYLFERMLGQGVQSTVWLFRMGEKKYAAKVTSNRWIYEERKGDPQYWKKRMLSLAREMVFLSLIDSPFVIKQVEIIKTSNNYYSVLEYANGGSLQDLLNTHGRFSERVAVECIRQIIEGCQALYAVNVMHRDLKLDNILVHFPNHDVLTPHDLGSIDLETEPFQIKIADLGYARELTTHQ